MRQTQLVEDVCRMLGQVGLPAYDVLGPGVAAAWDGAFVEAVRAFIGDADTFPIVELEVLVGLPVALLDQALAGGALDQPCDQPWGFCSVTLLACVFVEEFSRQREVLI